MPTISFQPLFSSAKPLSRAFQQAYLTDVPPGLQLRSVAVRREETTAGVFLCSLMRDGLRCSVTCDGVMVDAGSIRRNHVYPPDTKQFTYGDLKKVRYRLNSTANLLLCFSRKICFQKQHTLELRHLRLHSISLLSLSLIHI